MVRQRCEHLATCVLEEAVRDLAAGPGAANRSHSAQAKLISCISRRASHIETVTRIHQQAKAVLPATERYALHDSALRLQSPAAPLHHRRRHCCRNADRGTEHSRDRKLDRYVREHAGATFESF